MIEVPKPMLRSTGLFFLLFVNIFIQTPTIFGQTRDTVTILGQGLKDEVEAIMLDINFRKQANIDFDQDSVYYNFGILSVEMITDFKYKIRVLFSPLLDDNKKYRRIYEPFLIYYQVRLTRKMGRLKLKDVKYLMGEL